MRRFLIASSVILYSFSAIADDRPCGIELGMWARDTKKCKALSHGDLGNDQNDWMVFRPGARWDQWETFCKIHDAILKDGICHYKISCRGEEGPFEEKETVRIINKKSIAFIYGSAQLSYIYCGPKDYSPYGKN